MRSSTSTGAWTAATVAMAAMAAMAGPARADEAPLEEPSVQVEPPPEATPPETPSPDASSPATAPRRTTPPDTPPPPDGPPIERPPPEAASPRPAPRLALEPEPPPAAPPPIEVGLAAGQVLVGTVVALGAGTGSALVFAAVGVPPLIFVSVLGAPAVGARVICALGRQSRSYDGDCSPAMLGGYLGAAVVGTALGVVFYDRTSSAYGEGAGLDKPIMAVVGAGLGLVIGTGIGATLGWHLGKHRRAGDAVVSLAAPPLPPPAALADWPELRPRSPAPPGGAAVGLPLLALRF